jgi:prepilin-type processing-associated H-X9-DG protein
MRTAFILSASLLFATAVLPAAEEPRFHPDACFPDGVLHASIANVSRLEERLSATLLGRMATHPGVRKAFEGFAALVKEKAGGGGGITHVTGKSPLELLALIRGEVALHVGVAPGGPPAIAVAIELGKTREAILEVRAKLRATAEEMTGSPLETATIEGVETTAWPGPTGPVLDGVLGTHLVIASTPDLFTSIASAHGGKGKPESATPREARYPDLGGDLAVSGREALLLVDLEALRGAVLANIPESERENAEKVLRVSGLDRVTSLGGALGFRDGGAESACRLGMRDGPGGILGVIAKSLPGLGDIDEALAQIPAAAVEVQAGRMDLGGLLAGIDAVVREAFPELGAQLDSWYAEAERTAGISVKEDLFGLGELAGTSFSIALPASGLFADEIMLVKTGSPESSSKLLEKLAARLGAKPRTIGPTGAVTYLNLTDGLLVDYLRGEILGSERRGMWTPSFPELMFLTVGAGIASADAGDGWRAVSTLPQAVIRHLEIHAKGPRLANAPEGAELASLIRREAKGAAAVMVSRGGGSGILAVYNSLLPIANALYPVLKAVGIDPAELPPAESFLADVKPGYLRLSVDPKGFTLRGHRVLETRAGVLAGVGVASMGAGFLVPVLLRGRGEAYTVQCSNNLRQLFGYAVSYSDKSGTRAYPFSEEGSLASLQLLIDFDPEGLEPRVFVCRAHGGREPVKEGGKVVLSPDTTSYEVVPWKLRNTALNAIWMYDREPAHNGGRNVLFSDGSVQWMSEGEFQRGLAENRERFSRVEAAPKKAAPRKRAAKKKAAE